MWASLSRLPSQGERIKFNMQLLEKYDQKSLLKPLVSKFEWIPRYVALHRDNTSIKTFAYEN